ncbi:MAG: phage tail assembly chaperone [Oscillospiraceae bacterium]|nr:phage tail assembly chaperone [Oscillospiraceae bacterium]
MYGYIGSGGVVGELFDIMPPEEQYHESYISQIIELPKGKGAGWRLTGGEWVSPEEAGRDWGAAAARSERDRLLDRCDTVYCNAANWEQMDGEEKAVWHIYKQTLRDITEQKGFPHEVKWPDLPGDL